jgi:uncharacterized protein with HEPN domain
MRRDRLLLIDMLNSADWIATFLADQTRASFMASGDIDEMRRAAIQKKLEIIGEAAHSLTDELKERYPDVPWRSMWGLRNVGVHAYFSIDWDEIWVTATVHVPRNRQQIAAILSTEFPDEQDK